MNKKQTKKWCDRVVWAGSLIILITNSFGTGHIIFVLFILAGYYFWFRKQIKRRAKTPTVAQLRRKHGLKSKR